MEEWTGITEIAAGSAHSVGLCADGSVVMAGGANGSCGNVSGWREIVAIAAGNSNVLGIDVYGNVFCVGNGKTDVSGMQNPIGAY